MPRIYGEDAGGMWSGGDWTPPTQPTQPTQPSPSPYDARQAGQDIAGGGATREEQYQEAYRRGLINAQQLRDALIEKDRLLSQWRGSQPAWGGNYQGYGYGGGGGQPPTTPPGVSPDWGTPSPAPWLNPQFWKSTYGGSQPTLNFANTDWASVAPQYRPGVESWLRLQGFKPQNASLGQYNYNTWAAPQQVQFSQDMVNTVPDESLRAWINKLLTGKGWM